MENNDTEQEKQSQLYLTSTNIANTNTFGSTLHQSGYEIKSFHQADDLAKAIVKQTTCLDSRLLYRSRANSKPALIIF